MTEPYFEYSFEPKVSAWETEEAQFIQIEFSPLHLLKIKVDKEAYNKKKGVK